MLRRVLLGLAALMGVAAILLALVLADTDDNDVSVTGNAAVDELIPPRNAQVLSQENVGIDLAFGYDARLTVNGVQIPREQIRHLPNIQPLHVPPRSGQGGREPARRAELRSGLLLAPRSRPFRCRHHLLVLHSVLNDSTGQPPTATTPVDPG